MRSIVIDLSKMNYSDNIYDICQKYNKDMPNIVLDNYHFDSWMMGSANVVPYIIKNGKMCWAVPIDKVSIGDFCNTFNTTTITFDTVEYFANNSEKRIKRDRYEFERNWEELRKHSKNKKRWLDVYRFKKYVNQLPVSPMTFVDSLYTHELWNIEDYCELYTCNKVDMMSILKCLGFEILIDNSSIRKNDDYAERMYQVCKHADGFAYSGMPSKTVHLLLNLDRLFSFLEHFFEGCKDDVRKKFQGNVHPNEYVRGEREKRWETLATICICSVLTIVVALSMLYVFSYFYGIKKTEPIDVWNSAFSSFLGSIIGAFISGIAAIGTSYLVINRNYKVDYHNERLSVLPVFDIQCSSCTRPDQRSQSISEEICSNIHNIIMNRSSFPMSISVSNIGKGISFNTQFKKYIDDWDVTALGLIKPGSQEIIILEKGNYQNIVLEYYDIYHNKYVQYFEISIFESAIRVVTKQPDLIERTSHARYQQ